MIYRTPVAHAPLLVISTRVTALDRDTGDLRWTYNLKAAARQFVIANDTLYVLDGDGIVHCLSLQAGSLVGRVDLKMEAANTMLFDDERLFVASDSEVVALNRNGIILWRSAVANNASFSLCGLAIPDGPTVQPDFSRAG